MRYLCLFLILITVGCASPARYLCGDTYCGQDHWQDAIDEIVSANFPNEKYKGILWEDDFMNAWVTTGNKIHTAEMNYHLETHNRRVAVVAHELAHLKQGHYYQKVGLAVATQTLIIAGEIHYPTSHYYTDPIANVGLSAFSRAKESEADRIAIKYLEKANYGKEDFLDLLYWMRDNFPSNTHNPLTATHPHISERIQDIRSLNPPRIDEDFDLDELSTLVK